MPVSLYYIENHIPPHFRRSYFFSLTYIFKSVKIDNIQIDKIIEKDQFRWALYLIEADENDDAPPNLQDLLGGEPEGGGCTLLQQHTHRHFVIS